jgi:hypothetical protein
VWPGRSELAHYPVGDPLDWEVLGLAGLVLGPLVMSVSFAVLLIFAERSRSGARSVSGTS